MVDTFAAGDTVIFVIVQTEIPQTDFGTDIQTVAHNPLVTVGEAAAVEVAFVAVVFHGTEREVTEIIGPRHSVDAEVMAFEGLAQPVTELRLYEPVLHLTVVLESKWIVIAVDGDTQVLVEAEFKSHIRCTGQPVQAVRTHCPLLRINLRSIN